MRNTLKYKFKKCSPSVFVSTKMDHFWTLVWSLNSEKYTKLIWNVLVDVCLNNSDFRSPLHCITHHHFMINILLRYVHRRSDEYVQEVVTGTFVSSGCFSALEAISRAICFRIVGPCQFRICQVCQDVSDTLGSTNYDLHICTRSL